MSMIAIGSAKSWGTTTAAMALAAVWPSDRRLLLAEFDPAGGDLAARFGLPGEPGLVSLAAAARRRLTEAEVWEHTQSLPGGLAVLVGPPSAEQSHAAIKAVAGRFVAVLGEADADVFVDCGRLGPGTPVLEVAHQAALAVLVARPTVEEVTHLRARVEALRPAPAEVVVVLVGERPYPAAQVAAAVGAEVVGVLADDPRAAELLAGRGSGDRALRRSALIRSAAETAEAIWTRLAASTRQGPAGADPARAWAQALSGPSEALGGGR